MKRKKIVLIDSSYPINSRNSKILSSLSETGNYDTYVISWDRNLEITDLEGRINEFYFMASAKPGNKVKKLVYMYRFYKYIRSKLSSIKPDIVIASHWDNLFISSILKKNELLVYENLDIPTSSNLILRNIFQKIESFALKKADMTIHASRFFKPLYMNITGKQFVLENKPLINHNISLKKDLKTESSSFIYKIAFIGNVRYFEILKNLIDVVATLPNIRLDFYGDGLDYYLVKQYIVGKENVFLHGKYRHEDVGQFYKNSDLIWAVYPNKDYNVKYAISNKFHESLFYNVPCVFAKDTKLGEFVESENIGYTVDPYDVSSIYNLLNTIRLDKFKSINKKKTSMSEFLKNESSWSDDIQTIIEEFVHHT